MTTSNSAFDEFVSTIAALRAPDGCPWDKEQTHESIAKNMIEEAYEAVDAIEARSVAHLREELGDVLLQVVLQSQIAADQGEFTIYDVCADINAKMIRRHPHVFGDASVEDANGVMDLWEQVKLAEKEAKRAEGASEAAGADEASGVAKSVGSDEASGASDPAKAAEPAKLVGADDPSDRPATAATGSEAAAGGALGASTPEPGAPSDDAVAAPRQGDLAQPRAGLLDDTPRSFPALMECQKISRKAAAAGFEWDTVDDVWEKVAEESAELREAYAAAPKSANGKISAETEEGKRAKRAAELELGDVLFATVNVARRMGLDAESALRASNAKFRARWSAMEQIAWQQGRNLEDFTTEDQNVLWSEVKQNESE